MYSFKKTVSIRALLSCVYFSYSLTTLICLSAIFLSYFPCPLSYTQAQPLQLCRLTSTQAPMALWNLALAWLTHRFPSLQAHFLPSVSVIVLLLCLSPPLTPVCASQLLDSAVLNIVHIPKTGGSSVNGFLRRFESTRFCNRTPCCHYRQFQTELAAADFRSCNTITYESDHNVIAYIEDMVATAASSANTSSSSTPQSNRKSLRYRLAHGQSGAGGDSTRRKVVHAAVFRRPLDHILSQGKHDVKAGRIAAVEEKWRNRPHRKQQQQEQHGDETQTAAKGHGYNPKNLQTRKFGGLNATLDFIDSALAVGVSEYLEQFLVVLQYKLLQSLDDISEGESDPGIQPNHAGKAQARASDKVARQRQQLLSRPLPCFKSFIDQKNFANRIDRPYKLDASDIAKIRELTWEDEIAYAHALARLYADYDEVR